MYLQEHALECCVQYQNSTKNDCQRYYKMGTCIQVNYNGKSWALNFQHGFLEQISA